MNKLFLGNPLSSWLITLLIIVSGFILLRVFRLRLLSRLKWWSEKSRFTFDDFLVSTFDKQLFPFLYFLLVYAAVTSLTLSTAVTSAVRTSMFIILIFFALLLINSLLQYIVHSFLKKQEDSEIKYRQARGLVVILKFLVWIMGGIFLLDNFGYNVTTLIAGLGIGGIAIALAAQTILADLFSYFVILFDGPFQIGDFIVVDDKMGVVEYIGIKTTRLRTLGGEQLVCSNKDLTDSRVHNYKRMEQRRVVINVGVIYQTPACVLEEIPSLIKDIIGNQSDVLFDRGHFTGFGDCSLNFEFVYYVMHRDYNIFMNKQQVISLEIFKLFEKRKIQFAYPTQTLFVNNMPIRVH